MFLNQEQLVESTLYRFQDALLNSGPNHVVIDNSFNNIKLKGVTRRLHEQDCLSCRIKN